MPDIVVGLDIGSSHIKAVSLEKSSYPPKLLRYALVPSAGIEKKIFAESNQDIEGAANLIKGFMTESGFSLTDKVVAVIPENRVFSKVISMPMLEGKEFDEAIKWEAEQHLPNALSDVYLKYTILGQDVNKRTPVSELIQAIRQKAGIGNNTQAKSSNEGEEEVFGTMDVLLVAAPKSLVDRYMKIINMAGLMPLGIEPISISIVRSTVNESTSPPTIVANFGQSNIDFYFAVQNSLRFVHMTNFGVDSFIKSVAKQLDISPLQANEYVFTYGLKDTELDGKIKELMMPVMNMIIEELKKIQRYVESRNQYFPENEVDKVVKRIIITGGGALIPDMIINLASEVAPEVQYANPWKNLDVSAVNLTPKLQELGPMFVAAIGAALK